MPDVPRADQPQPFAPGSGIYELDINDPTGELIDRGSLSAADMQQINALMRALGGLRDAEQALSEASLRYMKLNRTDMRALHFLITCENSGSIATPGAIASHLAISTASTTKLLDRLEHGGHITRSPHPFDRRALAIAITPSTKKSAVETVGRQHARRFIAAANLSVPERDVVIRFLTDMKNKIALGDEPWATLKED